MIPEINKYELVEMYLGGELTGDQLYAFRTRLIDDPELAEILKLSQEIEEAMSEKDVMELRGNLQDISNSFDLNETFSPEISEAYFGLAEEIEDISDLNLDDEELNSYSNSLQKLHLQNHKKASKETVHQVYKDEIEPVSDNESGEFSEADELLFREIQDAVMEKDIMELRANIQTIAKHMPAHNRTVEEIEEYVSGDLSDKEMEAIELDAESNLDLANDIQLFHEVNEAIGEEDVMELRAALNIISENESSHARQYEEIENFLSNEMDEAGLASFEDEMAMNPDLAADVKLFREVDEAIGEKDVMELRASLKNIRKAEENEKNREVRGIRPPKTQRILWYTVAASIVLILGIASFVRNQSYSNQEIYRDYYQTYKVGIFRSADNSTDNVMTDALKKFNQSNYDEALKLFNQVLADNDNNPAANFYVGVAYQEEKEYAKAIQSYAKVVKHNDNLFTEQAQWYIGLCYLQREEKDEALKVFRQIASGDGFYASKAKDIMKKLD
jgi:tetratricopeptide (TPR) repeat protein